MDFTNTFLKQILVIYSQASAGSLQWIRREGNFLLASLPLSTAAIFCRRHYPGRKPLHTMVMVTAAGWLTPQIVSFTFHFTFLFPFGSYSLVWSLPLIDCCHRFAGFFILILHFFFSYFDLVFLFLSRLILVTKDKNRFMHVLMFYSSVSLLLSWYFPGVIWTISVLCCTGRFVTLGIASSISSYFSLTTSGLFISLSPS